MRPTEWVQQLLKTRELDIPDGRPLYQYRLTDSEYSELFSTLQFATRFGIGNVNSMLNWDIAFVMYASEWWRREYKGHWGWVDIFGSIGADYSDLPVGSRNDLIETGLRRWRRTVRVSVGHRNFLGTIATEGGLPLHQLSESGSGGWLRHILQPTLRRHIERGHSIPALIHSNESLIPRSYRSVQLSEILADIVAAVTALRAEHNLAAKDSPIKWLDEHQPQWRDFFPLPVNDAAARTLLTELIDTAAKAKEESGSGNPFECNRVLINADFTNPELVAQIELPSFVALKILGLGISDSLPSTLELEVFEPGGKSWPWSRAILTSIRHERVLKLSGSSFKLKGKYATSEIKVALKFRGQRILEVDVAGGELIDPDIPGLFRKIDGKWCFHGSATRSVSDTEALLYVPDGFDIEELGDLSSAVAMAPILQGKIWRLQGTVCITNGADTFQMGCGGEETAVTFELRGQKFPYMSSPREVYIGPPQLYERDLLSGISRRRYDSRVLAKPIKQAGGAWVQMGDLAAGVYQVKALDQKNNVLFSKTVGVLNKDYSHTLQPDSQDACRGSICISGVHNVEIAGRQPGVEISINEAGNDAEIDLIAHPQPPKSLELSLLPRNQGRALVLNYPFPSRGAILFDAAENLIPPAKILNLEDLHGLRIKIFNDKPHLSSSFFLTLSLKDKALSPADLRDIYIRVPLKLGNNYSELAVSDWLPMIKSLFGVAKSLDAAVNIALKLGPDTLLSIDVRRYEYLITREDEEGIVNIRSQDMKSISSEILEESKVLALCLDSPNMEPVTLDAQRSEGIHVGRWHFVPQARKAGPWIIYPDPESKLKFRSLLWTVGLNEDGDATCGEVKNLAEAISIPFEALRRAAITSELQKMAKNHDHSDWSYLEELWQRTSHLPMVTFDIWLVAIQVPMFLATLFVKERLDILGRLEDELPLIWELVSKSEWEEVLQCHKGRLQKLMEDDPELVDELLGQVIGRISAHTTSMLSMGMILNSSIREVDAPELNLMALPASNFLRGQMEIFYQELFRRQSDQEWPLLLSAELSRRFRLLPVEFHSLVEIRNRYQESVVTLPFVLSWGAIMSDDGKWRENSSQIFKILQLKLFDEDWFNSAFQILSGWLSQQALGNDTNVR